MSSTYEVGQKLVDLCKQNKAMEAVNTLYSPKIVSIEAMAMGPVAQRTEGLPAVKKKSILINPATTNGPLPMLI